MIVPTSSCPLQLRRSVLLALVCAALRPSLTLSLVPRNSGHHRGKGGGSGVGSGFGPSSVSGSGDNGGYRQMRAGINALAASQKGRRYMRLHLKLGDWFGSRAIQKIDYSSLEGAAQEAGRWALKGEVPQKSEQGYDIATFAGGCFWGLELAFQRVPGVVATSVGYTQGGVDQPTYDEVCSAETGHTEAVQVFYDPNLVTYEQLLSVFWGRINPLTLNRQGGDIGTQYRTGVYAHTPEQYAAALESVRLEQQKYDKPIVTEIMPAKVYWPAEGYHQQYLSTGGRFGAPQSAAKNCTDPIRCYG